MRVCTCVLCHSFSVVMNTVYVFTDRYYAYVCAQKTVKKVQTHTLVGMVTMARYNLMKVGGSEFLGNGGQDIQ